MYKKVMTVMGRKVIHHSPAKFPVSTDPTFDDNSRIMAENAKVGDDGMMKMLKRADEGRTSGTYGGMRKEMKPMQQESPKPAKALDSILDYLGRIGGGKK